MVWPRSMVPAQKNLVTLCKVGYFVPLSDLILFWNCPIAEQRPDNVIYNNCKGINSTMACTPIHD